MNERNMENENENWVLDAPALRSTPHAMKEYTKHLKELVASSALTSIVSLGIFHPYVYGKDAYFVCSIAVLQFFTNYLPFKFIGVIAAETVFFKVYAMTRCFSYRMVSLFERTRRERAERIILAINLAAFLYANIFVMGSILLMLQDREYVIREQNKSIHFVQEDDLTLCSISDQTSHLVPIISLVIYAIYIVGAITVYSSIIVKTMERRKSIMSEKTRSLHRSLYLTLCVQIIFYAIFVGIPIAVVALLILFKWRLHFYYEVVSWVFAICSISACTGTPMTVVILVKPYRMALLSYFKRKNIYTDKTTRVTTQITRTK